MNPNNPIARGEDKVWRDGRGRSHGDSDFFVETKPRFDRGTFGNYAFFDDFGFVLPAPQKGERYERGSAPNFFVRAKKELARTLGISHERIYMCESGMKKIRLRYQEINPVLL